ncbi:GNAT family N-acetyltransferase [Tumebacillus sp. ITR2]|uniref:GNAT family N-acetyltransferase n=1 Tax=Tumebacillus amylolyticus TaxID=2801339 RepID=A0ABS1JBY4_9BACL|nr:GNAT family N-acetyltransferase [Tumebacillus amylolyticus]MBL0387776.1 GNAT family N-acetyltransferase [Tumebacillus amylolyticus]
MTTPKKPPILLDFPDRFETDRLLVRLPLPGDGQETYKAMMESMDELKPWMHFAHNNQTEEDVEQVIREAHVKFLQRSDLRLMGFHKETGELAVSSGLHRINWDSRVFEIGYWVRTKYANQGLVTELVSGLEQYAIRELQANRILIRCDARNERSAKVPERLGYTLEGIMRGEEYDVYGQLLTDTKVYAKVRGHEF